MRIAVTGAGGRLGRALIAALEEAPFTGPRGPIEWSRPAFDLDTLDPATVSALLGRDRPEVVVHGAAWTDVDGCARDPDLAHRRNATATATLADACAGRGVELILISTNEVFRGDRTNGSPYRPADPADPANPYGASKRAGELAAAAAFAGSRDDAASGAAGPRLAIVRTSWLFGPGAPDFPRKILAAAEHARSVGQPLRAVADEWASPTYVADLAEAVVELLAENALAAPGRRMAIHHLVNTGVASRADWARDVIGRAGIRVPVEEVPSSTWQRPSTPPRWGVLAPTALPSGEPLPPWQDAMGRYAPSMVRPP